MVAKAMDGRKAKSLKGQGNAENGKRMALTRIKTAQPSGDAGPEIPELDPVLRKCEDGWQIKLQPGAGRWWPATSVEIALWLRLQKLAKS